MSLATSPESNRVDELQADLALEGLEPAQSAELSALLSRRPDLVDDGMELAAAALDLARLSRQELQPLPAHLGEQLRSAVPRQAPAPPARVLPGPGSWLGQLGWVAAAACLVWIAFGWQGGPAADPDPALTERERVAQAPDRVQIPWTATADQAATGLQGELSWSSELQLGVMHIQGLERNDPSQTQYQLWIFDRAQEHPIDGGVFDITQDDQWIPIDAKIRVAEAWQFAVTVERPGGVVVSNKERIVALAAP